MKMSKSKINTYLKCPLEFKFQYIDEIEAEPNRYMALGSDVHLIAEKFSDKFRDNVSDIDIESELFQICRDLDVGYGLESHVENLSLFFKQIYIEDNYRYFSSEEYLLDEKNRFSGITDIILKDENNNLVVIDYKTSNSNSFSKYRRELCYYKLLVENVYERDVSQVGIFFTKNGRLRLLDVEDNENKRRYLSPNEITEAVDTLNYVRSEVNQGHFPPKDQYLCRYCTYKKYCEEYFQL